MNEMQARDCYYVYRALHDGACPNCGYTAVPSHFEQPLSVTLQGVPNLMCPKCRFGLNSREIAAIEKLTPQILKRRLESLEACRKELVKNPKVKVG